MQEARKVIRQGGGLNIRKGRSRLRERLDHAAGKSKKYETGLRHLTDLIGLSETSM
jgi:hypothetical protein